jgi:outer membrane protein assembly factor BamB
MGILEIHDARGQVRRVRISHDVPVMFGSDPMCDLVLEGAGVYPFHGRIRWKSHRFKADASPEVPSIEVNGVAVKSKSLYQGDELRVGPCRIFLLSVQDGPDHGQKTQYAAPLPTTAPGKPPAPPSPARAASEFAKMEMAPPSLEEAIDSKLRERPTGPLKRIKYGQRLEWPGRAEGEGDEDPDGAAPSEAAMRHHTTGAASPAPFDASALSRKKRGLLGKLDRAPGDESVISSPLAIGLMVTLAALVVFSVMLWGMIARSNAQKQYAQAFDAYEATDYRNAARDFDRFLEANPREPRANKARVLRAMARVRQFTGDVGTSWSNALKEARGMVDEVGQLAEYRDANMDLAEQLRKIAEGLTERATSQADPRSLAEAESAIALHAQVAGAPAKSLIEKIRLPERIVKARAAIERSQTREAELARMDAAIKVRKPGDAYAARDALSRRYPDLAGDRDVVTRLIEANTLIREAVSFDPSGRPGETTPRPDPLGPSTSLVFRLEPGKTPAGNRGSVVYALVDGQAFGLDGATGAPRWQVPVGVASPFPPVAVLGESPSALVVDGRSNELLRIDGRTGALIWRQGLGGPVTDPPLLLGSQILQPTPDGRIVQVDLGSGSVRGTLTLGRALGRTPVADDTGSHVYALADEDCLFVLAVDPLSCVAVEYLGHDLGSVHCPPARVGPFYIMAEDHEIDRGRWRVCLLEAGGARVRQVQEIPIAGWTRSSPTSSGPVIWSASDRGELVAFAVGAIDSKTPLTSIARVAAGTEYEGPAFGLARSDRDLWLGSARSGRYELDLENNKLTPAWTLIEAGPALAPPQAADKLVVLTQQEADGPGTSLWGVEASTGTVRWRTVLGASWPVPLAESKTGDVLSTISSDGLELTLARDQLRKGGFVEQPLPSPGKFRLPTTTTQRLELEGATVIVPSADADKILVREGSSGEFRSVDLPAPLAAPALGWGGNLLVPGSDGRAYLIDPRTGLAAADPFVPPFDRSKPIHWRTPSALSGDAVLLPDSEMTLRRLSVDRTGRPRLTVTAEQKLDKPLDTDPASTGQALVIATEDGRVRSLASRDLGSVGSWPLDGKRWVGPVVVAEHAFVADDAGNVVAFAPDGRRLWSAKLPGTIAAGPPAVRDQEVWVVGTNGSLHRFALADGQPRAEIALDILPRGGLLAAGTDVVVPCGASSIRSLDPATAGARTGDKAP